MKMKFGRPITVPSGQIMMNAITQNLAVIVSRGIFIVLFLFNGYKMNEPYVSPRIF